MEEDRHHRGILRRRRFAQGNAAEEEVAEDEQERRKRELGQAAAGGDPGVRRGKEKSADCNSCRICREPWASSGAHRICCIPCGHVYGRSCLEALLVQCRGMAPAAKCLSCAREFKGKDMLDLYLQHTETEEQMITTHEQEAPAARMQVPTEDQQEAAWQQIVVAMAAEAQQRAEMAHRRAEIGDLARKKSTALKILVLLVLLLILIIGCILYLIFG